MMTPGKVVWLSVKRWLEHYCRQDKSIRHCFIRHSTASGAQNPLLSDFDLAFFVEAGNFDELQIPARRLRDMLRKSRILNCIVLPATDAAYRMCAVYYPLRSMYPVKNWFCIYGDRQVLTRDSAGGLPFDHAPEAFLSSYINPVMQRRKRSHLLERALMRRKIQRDCLWATGHLPENFINSFHGIAMAEVQLWDKFYNSCDFPVSAEPIRVKDVKQVHRLPFEASLTEPRWDRGQLAGLASIWVYPCFFDDRTPYLVLNLDPMATAGECKIVCTAVLSKFEGLNFRLQLGTERSMLARLNGLSRVSLIDPWLFTSSGRCLVGDESLRMQVRGPAIAMVKEKLNEYLLYLSYRVFCLRPYPYALYSLAFTLDHLFRRRELLTNDASLAELYGKDFLPQSRLQGPEGRRRFVDTWKQLHGFDLFK